MYLVEDHLRFRSPFYRNTRTTSCIIGTVPKLRYNLVPMLVSVDWKEEKDSIDSNLVH